MAKVALTVEQQRVVDRVLDFDGELEQKHHAANVAAAVSITALPVELTSVVLQYTSPFVHDELQHRVFMLDALGGSGKSVTMAKLLHEASKNTGTDKRHLIFCAPQHTAVESFKETAMSVGLDIEHTFYMFGTVFRVLGVKFLGMNRKQKLNLSPDELKEGYDRPTYTLDKAAKLHTNFLIIVDEAGTLNARFTLRLLEFLFHPISGKTLSVTRNDDRTGLETGFVIKQRVPNTVVFVGDSRQLMPPLTRGFRPPMFRYLHENLSSFHKLSLSKNLRVQDPTSPYNLLLTELCTRMDNVLDGSAPIMSKTHMRNFINRRLRATRGVEFYSRREASLAVEKRTLLPGMKGSDFLFISYSNRRRHMHRAATLDVAPIERSKLGVRLIQKRFFGHPQESGRWHDLLQKRLQFVVLKRHDSLVYREAGEEVVEIYQKLDLSVKAHNRSYTFTATIPLNGHALATCRSEWIALTRRIRQCAGCRHIRNLAYSHRRLHGANNRYSVYPTFLKKGLCCGDHGREKDSKIGHHLTDPRFCTLYFAQGKSVEHVFLDLADALWCLSVSTDISVKRRTASEVKEEEENKGCTFDEFGEEDDEDREEDGVEHVSKFHPELKELEVLFGLDLIEAGRSGERMRMLNVYKGVYVALSRSRGGATIVC